MPKISPVVACALQVREGRRGFNLAKTVANTSPESILANGNGLFRGLNPKGGYMTEKTKETHDMWIVSGCGVSFIVPKSKVPERMAEIIEKGGLPEVRIYTEAA
jgi:hypothetical protein